MRHWLLKSEPTTYSIDDLKRDGKTSWEGVRNYQARNFLRDMKIGDLVLFYHSNAEPPGIAGIAKVIREAYPDNHDVLDPKNSTWVMVDVAFVEKFSHFISLEKLRNEKSLANMLVLKKGSRLSVQPVEKKDFEKIRTQSTDCRRP